METKSYCINKREYNDNKKKKMKKMYKKEILIVKTA